MLGIHSPIREHEALQGKTSTKSNAIVFSLAMRREPEIVEPQRSMYGSGAGKEYSPIGKDTRSPNQTATTLASSMIRSSLNDIRRKLDNMKKNKEDLGQDLLRYEQQQMQY